MGIPFLSGSDSTILFDVDVFGGLEDFDVVVRVFDAGGMSSC